MGSRAKLVPPPLATHRERFHGNTSKCCAALGSLGATGHCSIQGLDSALISVLNKTSGTGLKNFLSKLLRPAGTDGCMFPAGADGHGCKPLLQGWGRAQHVSARIGVLACAASKIAYLKKIAGKLGFMEQGKTQHKK